MKKIRIVEISKLGPIYMDIKQILFLSIKIQKNNWPNRHKMFIYIRFSNK